MIIRLFKRLLIFVIQFIVGWTLIIVFLIGVLIGIVALLTRCGIV